MWVTTQKWCKYNFGDDDESTVALSRNVESKESFHTALKYCQIKCRGERERERSCTWKRLVTFFTAIC